MLIIACLGLEVKSSEQAGCSLGKMCLCLGHDSATLKSFSAKLQTIV